MRRVRPLVRPRHPAGPRRRPTGTGARTGARPRPGLLPGARQQLLGSNERGLDHGAAQPRLPGADERAPPVPGPGGELRRDRHRVTRRRELRQRPAAVASRRLRPRHRGRRPLPPRRRRDHGHRRRRPGVRLPGRQPAPGHRGGGRHDSRSAAADRRAARGRHLPPGARRVLVRADSRRPVRNRRHGPAGARAARHLADRTIHVRGQRRPSAPLDEHRDRLPPRRGGHRDRPAARARAPDRGHRPVREEGCHPGPGRDRLHGASAARRLRGCRAGAVARDHPAADAPARAARAGRAVAGAGRSDRATSPGGGAGAAAGARPARRPQPAAARAASGRSGRSAARGGRGRDALLGGSHAVPPGRAPFEIRPGRC